MAIMSMTLRSDRKTDRILIFYFKVCTFALCLSRLVTLVNNYFHIKQLFVTLSFPHSVNQCSLRNYPSQVASTDYSNAGSRNELFSASFEKQQFGLFWQILATFQTIFGSKLAQESTKLPTLPRGCTRFSIRRRSLIQSHLQFILSCLKQ